MLVSAKNSRVRLAVMDVDTQTPKIIGDFGDADIGQFHWVNDNRLVFNASDRQIAQGDNYFGPGLFAINRDGTMFRELVQRSNAFVQEHTLRNILSSNTYFFTVDRANDSENIFVVQVKFDNMRDVKSIDLLRLNTKTGRATTVERPGNSRLWVIDQNGEPRVTVTRSGKPEAVHYKDPATDKWRMLGEFDIFSNDGFTPYFFAPDGTFYVIARNGRDKQSVYVYDLTANRINPEPVVMLADYDFDGDFVYNTKKVLGVRYETDAPSTLWFDEGMKKFQKSVDDLLPATVNHISVGRRTETPYLLVEAASDVQPSIFLLYHTETGKLTALGKSFPSIDARLMAPKDMVRYPARDGLEIPAYLTLPKDGGKKNLPMVVLVHGGPYLRGGSWLWRPDAQFLASRGYAVLEPEFRGSTGFGHKHFKAGWKQWGLAMQNDIADGAKWAIAQGIVDPKRICIAGASYGGYATLMGLMNDPDLFRCGIDWVGVTDIDLMYSVTWSDSSDEWKRYGMPTLIGDREKDAVQLKATSPLENAAHIKQPLLLAYGGSDRRVPIVHGIKFRDAVKATNPDVEWIEYPEEGHGWALVKTRVDFWTQVEKFLDRNIGKP